MEFRRRHNSCFASLGAAGTGDPIGVISGEDIEIERWLGICDRSVIRGVPGMEPVLLDIQAWRVTLLDPYHWLPAGCYMAGARVPGGVVGVMSGSKPLLKTKSEEDDRLGRKKSQELKSEDPWYMRTL
ncbi:hypothetical protein [Marinobacter sp. P4B1]|uniref:hypothetical protein n=1 Tax=Marinobacter sp. P4B1 TaxID=1119533 RepID=UPI00071C204C|nr:hypothetical protein [Marinobacter sp. P4B1]KRW83644.1 hypothetical protein AQ621_16480 [Marinobacter sp. P4B1]